MITTSANAFPSVPLNLAPFHFRRLSVQIAKKKSNWNMIAFYGVTDVLELKKTEKK